MHEKMIAICGVLGIIGATIAEALGGWDNAIIALLVFMAVDYATGLICAIVFRKSNKSTSGGLSSAACWRGLVKKCCTLLIVVVGHYADVLLGTNFLRTAIVLAFCVEELISITENMALMDFLPDGVQNVLDKIIDLIKNKNDKDK